MHKAESSLNPDQSSEPREPKMSLGKFLKLNSQHITVLFALAFLGVGLFLLGVELKIDILRDFGVLFLTIFMMSFIYELILRRLFQKDMKELIKAALHESRPPSLQRILKAGVVDAYKELEINLVKEWIENATGTEIKISNIYFPELINQFNSYFIKAIKDRGCTLKILLCDAAFPLPLEKRALSTETYVESYTGGIPANIRSFKLLWEALEKPEWQSRIEIRLHHNFISSSVWGFRDFYCIAFYHYMISAVESVQLKVNKRASDKDSNSPYFDQIDASFNEQWRRATKKVIFGKEEGMLYDEFNKCHIINLPGYVK